MDRVKLGFVGAGYMGQLAHLVNFAASEKCQVVAIAEQRERLGRLVAERYRIPKVYQSHLDLCADPEVEAVVEITSDDMHAPVAIDLLNAGKHVFTEKPISTNLEDAERMVEAARRSGVKLMVGYMKRYDPGVEAAKAIFDGLRASGEIGAITFARAHCFGGDWVCNVGRPISTDEPYPAAPKTYPRWLPAEYADRFRGFNNVYCHNVNLLRFLVGDVRRVAFSALDGPARVVVLELEGFTATLETGSLSARSWDEETKVYFRDGWVEVATPPPLLRNAPARVEVYKAGRIQQTVRPLADWDWSFRRAAEHFLDCILSDAEPRSSGEDCLRDMAVIEEVFKVGLGIGG